MLMLCVCVCVADLFTAVSFVVFGNLLRSHVKIGIPR